MSFRGKQWIWPDHDNDQAINLARNLQLPPALACLLIKRGINDPEKARAFLCPDQKRLYSPWLMMGMEPAVKRLVKALERNEKVIIHGDYDADGIAASVILVETIRQLGGEVDYFLPSRFDEGYGLHIEPLKQFRESGFSLVVTVDCGINAVEEAAYASEIGLDLIITDHHQPLAPIKEAFAIINPLQQKCLYPFKELSGAGVAFKLASALMEKSGSAFPGHLLDLAALGTAADVVPLLDENRIIVSAGLDVLRRLERVGFKALTKAVSLDQDRINSTALSYILAPAINAAGRMGEALPAAKLLLEKDKAKAMELAIQLHQSNQLRRSTEQKILREAEEAAYEQLSIRDQCIITLASESWHHGVIGIVASRLVEKFNRPVAMIALEDGEGRGSARSIPGFDITAALTDCASLLERFGGHEQAAGFTIQAEKIDLLRDSLNRYARENLGDSQFKAKINIEAELSETDFEFNLVDALEQMEPFGTANPRPIFGSRAWEVQSWRLVGADKKHLKLNVRKGNQNLSPIIFSGTELEPKLERGRLVDLAFKLKNGSYRDQKTLEVEVKDLNYSDMVIAGLLEVIDHRNKKDRLLYLNNILGKKAGSAVIFAATAARVKKIKKNCPTGDKHAFITSGALNGNIELPEDLNQFILYDLPLHEGLLRLILEKMAAGKDLTIYLLFKNEDLERNRLLLDHSLPTKEQLEDILLDSKTLNLKPAPSFWERVDKISSEVNLPGDGFALLESSPTFIAARDLRDNCEQFQKLLLDSTLEEIAIYLHNLTGN